MATLMTTADLEITYNHTPSHPGFDYRVSLNGLWVASATTFHAADLVADEMRYRMFLANDPPGDDPAPETGLGSSDDEGDDPDAIIDLRAWCRARNMDGYRPDACGPGSYIDRPIAEKQICKRCSRCCTYVAYRRPGSYRAVAACWPCNRGHEF